MARRIYCVGTTQIFLADATILEYVRSFELYPRGEISGETGMVKWHTRIVFVATMFCKSVANGPGFERGLSSRHACFAETVAGTECDGQTDRRTDGQTTDEQEN